jgi:hypothetical protein
VNPQEVKGRVRDKSVLYEGKESNILLSNAETLYSLPMLKPFVRSTSQCFLRWRKLRYGYYCSAEFNLHFLNARKQFSKKTTSVFSPSLRKFQIFETKYEDDEDELYVLANIKKKK